MRCFRNLILNHLSFSSSRSLRAKLERSQQLGPAKLERSQQLGQRHARRRARPRTKSGPSDTPRSQRPNWNEVNS